MADEILGNVEVLTYCKVTLTKEHGLQFETPDDEIIGRGLIDALRAHFDQKCVQLKMARAMDAASVRQMHQRLRNGGNR